MSDFQADMNHAVQGFVAQITELARRAALETLESAFGGKAGRGRSAAVAIKLPIAATRAGRPRGGRGAKRTAADLQALSDKFAAFVKANPGLRIEQINKQLGTSTKDLALPIRKLLADGVIAAKGQKRSTTYIAGKRAAKK
jgi:predicted HTH transcriptional regulator